MPAYIRLIPHVGKPSQTQFRSSTHNAELFRRLKHCNKLACAQHEPAKNQNLSKNTRCWSGFCLRTRP